MLYNIFIKYRGLVFIMKFEITNLNPKCSYDSVTVDNVDDLLSSLSDMKCGISKYTLSKVKFFACCSLDLYFSSKKYKFFLRKVIK